MKWFSLLLIWAVGLPCLAADEAAAVKTHPDSSSWESLFALDLSNAEKKAGVWTVEDGVMTASEDEAIWSQRDYKNFALDLEFKTAPNANSGVVVYCNDTKDWIPGAVEIQILDDFGEKWKDCAANWRCGAIFGHMAPTKSAVKQPGEWNRFTITCVGPQIDVVLNGEHILSADLKQFTSNKVNPDGSEVPSWLKKAPADIQPQGKIGLQGKHAGAPIWFRNVKVKELK